MPKKCIKFISGFLIPSLNKETFGERLKWVDKSKKQFQMYWFHKGGPKWTEQEAAVFVEWDKHKGHFRPNNKRYFTNSKQRFRALLYKLTLDGHLIKLKSEHKFIKMFCIGEGKKKKREKSNDISSDVEYELYNEDETSSEEKDESYNDLLRRTVSEDNVINVIEDHNYSSTDNSQNEDSNTNIGGSYYIMDPNVYYPTPEFEKRVLVQRNDGCEHIPTITAQFLETFLSQETIRYEAGNPTITRFSGTQYDPYLTSVMQNKPFSALPTYEISPITEGLESIEIMDDNNLDAFLKQDMNQI